jgi:hypothetical protein
VHRGEQIGHYLEKKINVMKRNNILYIYIYIYMILLGYLYVSAFNSSHVDGRDCRYFICIMIAAMLCLVSR